MTFLADLAKTILAGAFLLALTVLACFAVGWCLGWVWVGVCAVAAC